MKLIFVVAAWTLLAGFAANAQMRNPIGPSTVPQDIPLDARGVEVATLEPARPACSRDVEEFVIVISDVACTGACNLGRFDIRFADDHDAVYVDPAPEPGGSRGFVGESTQLVGNGFKFTDDGLVVRFHFFDEGYVLAKPIGVRSPNPYAPKISSTAVPFPSNKIATISFAYQIYPVAP